VFSTSQAAEPTGIPHTLVPSAKFPGGRFTEYEGSSRVYVTWEEVTPTPDNGDTYHPDGQSQIVLTKSANGGASWSTPAKVDAQAVGHQWWLKLAYDKSKDTLAVIYFDSWRCPRSC
jgi:hypothetical protein